MDYGLRFFTMMHRFRQLHVPERLGLLPRSEHLVLEVLCAHEQKDAGQPALSSACIARRLKVTAPAISRTIRQLRERGLIDVTADPNDRRGTCIRLTPDGRRMLDSDRTRIQELMQRAMERLEPGELDRFFATFDRLCDSITCELDRACADGYPLERKDL